LKNTEPSGEQLREVEGYAGEDTRGHSQRDDGANDDQLPGFTEKTRAIPLTMHASHATPLRLGTRVGSGPQLEGPMKEHELKLVAEVMALRILLIEMMKRTYQATGVSKEEAAQIRQRLVALVRKTSLQGRDPTMSDHVTAEVEEALELILRLVEGSLELPPL